MDSRDIAKFRGSIAPDLYSVGSFVLWPGIETALADLERGVAALQEFADGDKRTRAGLQQVLQDEPQVSEVLRRLLVAPVGAGFRDGRALGAGAPATAKERAAFASLAVDLGLWKILPRGVRVDDLLRIALVAADSRRRGFRRRRDIEQQVGQLVEDAVTVVASRLDRRVERLNRAQFPDAARRGADVVIAVDGIAVAAIAAVFEAQTGGRQQRNFRLTYPEWQQELDRVPMSLILVADGQGVKDLPLAVLERVFESVGACMTLAQAEGGQLADAIERAVESGGLRATGTAPVDAIIAATLRERGVVASDDLPLPAEQGRLSLASFLNSRQDLALSLSSLGDTIRWEREGDLERVAHLSRQFSPPAAAALLTDLVGGDITDEQVDIVDIPQSAFVLSRLPSDDVVPTLVVGASASEPLAGLVRSVSAHARAMSPDARVVALVVPDATLWRRQMDRQLQRNLAASVVVVDIADLRRFAQQREPPRDNFVAMLLEQADLTKASPFVYTSVTPDRMFFGRETEMANLMAMVPTNSGAVIGGRRIGKTSLLRRLFAGLQQEGFAVYYGDCQAVGSWEEFARMARRRWDIHLSEHFHPDELSRLADAARLDSGPVVLLLDEVDRLLGWDTDHAGERVPEAFFRACRAISQEGRAQFVFSGERMIAERLWDPASPHWNFCQPVPLRQLSRGATEGLLTRPLESLQLEIVDRDAFHNAVWRLTSGHPRMAQYLGDSLVRDINDREPEDRRRIAASDLASISDTDHYKREYLDTYWGQATALEQMLSIAVAAGATTRPSAQAELAAHGLECDDREIDEACRMLELYGVIDARNQGFELRAEWFPQALQIYGGPSTALEKPTR